MGTKTISITPLIVVRLVQIKKDPQTWGRKQFTINLFKSFIYIALKKDPQTWGRVVKRLRAAVRRSSSAQREEPSKRDLGTG